jgi:hypothetical protein
MAAPASPGKTHWDKLRSHLGALRTGACDARERPTIWGVTPQGYCVGDKSPAAFLAEARRILRDSGQAYRWGNAVVYESRQADDPHLRTLSTQGCALPKASAHLSNLFTVGVKGEDSATQSAVPAGLAAVLLADEDLAPALPAIEHYARRPVFDKNFRLCGPGWHADGGILVHGDNVVPAELPPGVSGGRAVDRLPHFLRGLLREFSWRSDADLVNAVGILLTGVLINHFIETPHPMALIDGNQKGLGKTLLAQCVGQVLDGAEPARTRLCDDEELEKRLCTLLLSNSRTSLVFLDNVRTRIDSALLEQNVLSPLLQFRILKTNTAVSRPNTYLWVVTSNMTAATEDLINRSVPIRLYYEGDPRERPFAGDPSDYAKAHRLDILGELLAMVLRWKEQGMPRVACRHRCERWAGFVGGILHASGLTEFLVNVGDAEQSMDEGLQDLGALAEHVLAKARGDLLAAAGAEVQDKGAPAKEWATVCVEAEVGAEQLLKRTGRSRDTWVGQFLATRAGRSVSVSTADGTSRATLRARSGRANKKLYYFELDSEPAPEPASGAAATWTADADVNPPGNPTGPAAAPAADPGSTDARPVAEPTAPRTEATARPSTEADRAPAPPPTPGAANDLEWY